MSFDVAVNANMMSSLLVGAALGLGPIIVGWRRDKLRLGMMGFFACLVSGVLLGNVFAGPVCGVFIALIIKDPDNENDDNDT